MTQLQPGHENREEVQDNSASFAVVLVCFGPAAPGAVLEAWIAAALAVWVATAVVGALGAGVATGVAAVLVAGTATSAAAAPGAWAVAAVAAAPGAWAGGQAVATLAALAAVVIADTEVGFGSSRAHRTRSPGIGPECIAFLAPSAFAVALAGAAVMAVASAAAAAAEPELAPQFWVSVCWEHSAAAAPVRKVDPE